MAEAVERLLCTLSDEEKNALAALGAHELVSATHFALGLYVRNHFGLNAGNEALRNDVRPALFYADPDEVSVVIVRALRERLQSRA